MLKRHLHLFLAFAFIPWVQLKNPVYSHANWSVKDASVIYRAENKTFYIFFSAFFESEGRIRSHVAEVKTTDFQKFSEPLFVWSGREHGFKGLASPEVIESQGHYILTYNSWGDRFMHPNQLFYAVSDDLEHWQKDFPLAHALTVGRRSIDAALAFDKDHFVLSWKESQKSQIAWAPTLEGPWTRIGQPLQAWLENAELRNIDGTWRMIYTGGTKHLPFIASLVNSGAEPSDWLSWGPPQQLAIPLESFNTADRANAAHLEDWRAYDGYFYLLYAGNTEKKSNLGRGNNKLGLARSKDGVHWDVP